jgi:hypothetical protein
MLKKFILAFAGAALLMAIVPSVASAAPPFTEPEECADQLGSEKGSYFLFEYNDSDTVGVDSGCADKNEVTSADVPGLIATALHVSCSDEFPGGVPEKSDLGDPDRRVVAWQIIKFDKGEVKKTCGVGDPIPSGGTAGYAATIALVAAAGAGLTALAFRRRQNNLAGTQA